MRNIIIILLNLFFVAVNIKAQNKIFFYDSEWNLVPSSEFAFYKRFVSSPSENGLSYVRDCYYSGETYSESKAKNIDKSNPNNTKYEGKKKTFDKNGNIIEIANYKNGVLDGSFYKKEGNKDYIIIYENGIPRNNEFIVSSTSGGYGRFDINTNKPIIETLDSTYIDTFYKEGIKYYSYIGNGIQLSLGISEVNDEIIGRGFKVYVFLKNNTFEKIDFDINNISIFRADVNGEKENSPRIFTANDYFRKGNSKITMAAIANSFFSITDGLSVSMNKYGNKTYSYDFSTSYLTKQYRIEATNKAMASLSQKMEGYLEKETLWPEDNISGFFYFNRSVKECEILFCVDINGIEYPFIFTNDYAKYLSKPKKSTFTYKSTKMNEAKDISMIVPILTQDPSKLENKKIKCGNDSYKVDKVEKRNYKISIFCTNEKGGKSILIINKSDGRYTIDRYSPIKGTVKIIE